MTRIILSGAMAAALVLGGCSTTQRPTTSANAMTDSELENVIKAKLDSDVQLRNANLDVDANVDHNEVKLSGTVPDEDMRNRAVEMAKSSRPGLVITDKIDVKPKEISRTEYTEEMANETRANAKSVGDKLGNSLDDAWIHTKLVSKLVVDKDTPARKINVDVVNGVVTLRGMVDTSTEKDEAAHNAQSVDGVKAVHNLLKVKNS